MRNYMSLLRILANPSTLAHSDVFVRTRNARRVCVQLDTSRPSQVFLESVPAHDLQEARVIGESERSGGLRHVPVVPLKCGDDDLTLGLRLQVDEGARGRLAGVNGGGSLDLRGDVLFHDRITI